MTGATEIGPLFDPAARAPRAEEPRRPRAYQLAFMEGWRRSAARGVLGVLATGLGKTFLAAQIAKETAGRTLFVVNRTTLGEQSLASLRRDTGQRWEMEQADQWATINGTANVVTLIQTLQDPKRFQRFGPDGFALVIIDECHRLMSKKFRAPLEFFTGARILGLTATPDGAKHGFRPLLTETCFHYPLARAQRDAWSVPFDFQPFQTDVDLGGVKWEKGDFQIGQLDEAMAGAAATIARAAVEKCGDLRTLVFCPGVKALLAACDAINALKPGSARAIYGVMDPARKRANIADHKSGRFQCLVSCDVIREGYDDELVQCLLIARPMGKRYDFEQIVGRGSRLWPGVGDIEDASERRAAIASSPKPHCRVIDLACVSLEHELVGPIDVLGGDYTEAERAVAKKRLRGGGDPMAALEWARGESTRKAAEKAAREAKVKLRRLEAPKPKVVTPRMRAALERYGVPTEDISFADAQAHLNREKFAEKKNWCKYATRVALERLVGVKNAWALPIDAGKALRDAWVENGKLKLSEQRIKEILGGKR